MIHSEGAGVTSSADPRFLHVANGTCTTRIIEASGIRGRLAVWADPLHDGPVPGALTDDELLEVRARHLCGPEEGAERRTAAELRDWRRTIAARESYDELVLWFEHDLFDQLNLIQILALVRERLPRTTPVSLVCIGAFPGRPTFKGLGELTPDELAPLLDTRQPVRDEQYGLAADAWRAFRSATPEPLDGLRRANTAALPFLGAAIARFLQDYPSTADGLSLTERRFLSLASRGPIDLRAAFSRMHDDEAAYYITDTSLSELAQALSAASPPLVSIARAAESAGGLPAHTITLTETGRAVLAGERDRVAACGIDRWLGGVHLRTGGPLWRWDEERQRIVHSPDRPA